MAKENTGRIRFRGRPTLFAELTKQSLEQLKDVIKDPTLSLDTQPAGTQKIDANVVTVVFQTKTKRAQKVKVVQAGGSTMLRRKHMTRLSTMITGESLLRLLQTTKRG